MLNTVGKTTTPNYQPDQFTHTKSSSSPDNKAPQLSDQLTNSSVPETKSRKIVKALLIPVRMLATCITVPVCAALECLAGMSTGLILGSSLIMKAYDNKGLILAMPVSTIVYPMSIVMGAGFAIAGCFLGIYDGFRLGWNFDKSSLANRGSDVKNRLDSFLKKDHQSTVEENVQHKQTNSVNDSSSPYPQNKAIGFINGSARPAASKQVRHNRAGLNAKPPGKIFTSPPAAPATSATSAASAASATITNIATITNTATITGATAIVTDTNPPGISLDFTSPQPITDNRSDLLPDSKQRQPYDTQKNPFEESE